MRRTFHKFLAVPLWLAGGVGCEHSLIHAPPTATSSGPSESKNAVNYAAILAAEGITDIAPRLQIGDKAPEIRVARWLQGAPVERFAPGQVYLVENWATWCAPCIRAIPELRELASQYPRARLTVLGINVEEDHEELQSFLAAQEQELGYPIAHSPSGWMQEKWMTPAGFQGLPASFVIDGNGKIAWAGHPAVVATVVEQVVAGRWNYAEAREQARLARLAVPYSRRIVELLEGTDYRRGYRLADAAIRTILRDQSEYLAALSYHIAFAPGLAHRDYAIAYRAGRRACDLTSWSRTEWIETLAHIRDKEGNAIEAKALRVRARRAASK